MKRLVLFLFFYLGAVFYAEGQNSESITVIRKDKAHNYEGEIFENSIPTPIIREGTMLNTFWRYFTRGHRTPNHDFNFAADPVSNLTDSNSLKVMWIGHATLLLEIDGKRFLTDPIFSERTSPFIKAKMFNFLWPKRFFKAPLKLEDLPKLDGIIISHDHSDHLDYNTIVKLSKTGVMFFVPLKVGDILVSWGINKRQIVEVNWWDSISLDKAHALVATPARHDSGRTPLSGKKDRTLWCSWVITGPKHKVFFGGDTGYSPDFKDIGNTYGPFDITFLPIGAYDKNWPYIHINPQQAVEVHKELKGNVLFPIHWGTFNVAIHPWDEPVKQVLNFANQDKVKICLPRPGELVSWPDLEINSAWWEKVY